MVEIKASYRRLARRYHPDVNPTDKQAKDKFIAINQAYEFLLNAINAGEIHQNLHQSQTPPTTNTTAAVTKESSPPPATKVNRKEKQTPPKSQVSPREELLKWQFYNQLQLLLKEQRFPRAIALVEGLAQRMPEDPEVRQWQAITYQRWGRYLIDAKQLEKARIYLKKALKIDPHNRSLWSEVEREFRRMEKIY